MAPTRLLYTYTHSRDDVTSRLQKDSTRVDIEAQDVVFASRALVAIVSRSLSELTEQVTIQQFRVLVILSEDGPRRIGDLASDLGVSSSTATRSIGRILRQGWATKRPDLGNGRETYIALTPQGDGIVVRAMASRLEQIREILLSVGPRERRSIQEGFALFDRAARRRANLSADGEP